jgi:hypothetical protein
MRLAQAALPTARCDRAADSAHGHRWRETQLRTGKSAVSLSMQSGSLTPRERSPASRGKQELDAANRGVARLLQRKASRSDDRATSDRPLRESGSRDVAAGMS